MGHFKRSERIFLFTLLAYPVLHVTIFYVGVNFNSILLAFEKYDMNAGKYYFDGIGQKELVGTGYGVYNAVNGYYSNVDNSEGLKRMDSLLYGDKARKIELAGNLILAA